MAAQPSDDEIRNFYDFTGSNIPKKEVIARYQGNNSDISQAVAEWFDDPTSQKYTYRWDEDQFNSDRDGGPREQNSHGVAFDIQGPDVAAPSYNHYDGNGLASRPPSRTSHNKSPLGKIIDLTAEHALADPRNSLPFAQHEDSDLEQALRASRAEAGLEPQESGIANASEPIFGPATRSQYETGKWDMVIAGKTSVTEIVVDPEPAERKRDLDVPAFLKPSVEDHRLNALMTIYHEIPLIRQIFLPHDGHEQAPNYGYDKQWWAGKAIDIPTVFGEGITAPSEVNMELQRLMAFLDKTDRSYGSVEALANLKDVKKELRKDPNKPKAAVLRAWKNGMPDGQYKNGKISKLFSVGTLSEAEESNPQEFGILELALPDTDSYQETLYDIADEALWHSLEPLNFDKSPYLSHVADVIAFQIEGDDTKKNIAVPITWYPDRYLKSARQAALNMRLEKKEMAERLEQNLRLQESLTNHHGSNGKTIKVKDLLNAALQHEQVENSDSESEAQIQVVEDEEGDIAARESAKKTAHLSAQLRNLVTNIDNKLKSLNEEKEKSIDALRKLSTLYTDPSSEVDPAGPKLHKYTLRGVSTTKSTMYICRRAEPDLIDIDLDGEEPKSNGDQWWRIHYASFGSNPVTIEKTTEETVLEATKSESKTMMLVYASEEAMNFEAKPLPANLEAFVHVDNRAFKAELIEGGSSQTQVSSPGKRKFDQREAEASSRWDSGASPRGDESTMNGEMSNHSDYLQDHEIIIGVEPNDIESNKQPVGQEMQERSSMMMMAGMSQEKSTIDSMDLDEVIEDEHPAGESAAVKRVGFSE
ncbi:hypothetical protein LSUB1_G001284 [Lachnellula subtilissima]|uniref:Uncharacterized protein n=1 Tax=Lachnellula subtilissima TaxID=602034 RepID=A0A8H8S075_9HELO|nr:hypothetical protein LSUB1_G001284 [Lachnellula subtilissima]